MRFERSVCSKSEPGHQTQIVQALNIAPAKGAKLIDEFEIIIPLAPSLPQILVPTEFRQFASSFPDRRRAVAAALSRDNKNQRWPPGAPKEIGVTP